MQRRNFITLLGGAAATWPLAARSQEPQQMRRVSILVGPAETDPEATGRAKAFRLGMRDLGWIEGRNVQIEYRFTGGNVESVNKHVAEVITLQIVLRLLLRCGPRRAIFQSYWRW
jgi:putative ABC transport system substrate-binding protein